MYAGLLRPASVGLAISLFLPGIASAQKLVTGGGAGTSPAVRVFDASGTDQTFLAYPAAFPGGVRVALGDVTGDGVLDIITGAGPGGGPHVRVWNGTDLTEVGGFFAYDPAFPGGVFVAAGDVNGDGKADIITGAGAGGGPHVRIWDGTTFAEIGGFFAYDPAFPGGVTVAASDVDGDGRADIVTGAGPGGGPHVRVWSGADFHEIGGFFAYDPAFAGGVNVAAADIDGDGRAEIVTGAGPGGGPHVRVWNATTFAELGGFFAYDPAFPGGVVVGTVDLDRDGRYEIVTGPALGVPLVRLWTGDTFLLFGEYVAYSGSTDSGVFVGSSGGLTALRFTSTTSTTFAAGSAGTFAVTTVGGASVPALTLTGTLPAGVAFTDNGNRTGTLAGTPGATTGGSYPLTFTATISGRPPVTQSFTLTVNQAPAITSGNATTFSLGAPGTFTVATTGVPTPQLTVAGPLPSGVTFIDNGDGTGTLSGTPASGTGGTYVLAISASNGIGTGTIQNFTLTVSGAPAITSAATTTFTVGSAGTFTVTAVGTPTPTLTVTGALPAGVTFVDNGNGTGTLSGTPAAGTGGAHPITFTASNGVLPNGTQAFTLSVNQPPAITSAASTTFTVGAAGSFTVTTSGFPAAALTRGGGALPAGLTFVDNGNGTGTLSGTPAAGTGGTYAITFTATNTAGATAPQAFTLTVSGGPAINSAATTTFTVGSAGTFTVTAAGTPTPALTVTGALPAGVTFLDNGNGTGTLSGTPAAGTGGAYPITFTASNGVLPNGTQAFTLNVNQTPTITSANSTAFSIGAAGSFTVTTSGFPAPALTRGGAALPSGITFVDNGNGTGTLSGTAAAGTGGTYAISFTATNVVGATAPQAFTLTVNQTPAITSANTTSFTVGTPGTFTVTTTAFPVAAITRTGAALPAGVTFVDNGDGTGTLSGTPAAGTAGAYAFTFTAANGVPPDATQAFTLNVQQTPAITSANATTFTVGAPGTFTVTTTGFPAPTVTQTGTPPTGVTFTSATRVLSGTATQTGAFPLQFTAANGVAPDAVQNFTLNVVCPAITVTPGAMAEGLYQTAYGGADFNQTGSTGSILTWGATGLPAGLGIDASTGIVSGTPTNTVLNAAVAVSVTDNFGCSGSVNTTLTVRPTTDNENYTGGVGNTQYIVGAVVPSTPNVFFNDNVKIGDSGPGTLTVTFPATSPNGVIAEGAADGTFVYTPNVGFAGPTDTFTYTLTDGNGVANTGTVTINLSGMVWYVNSAGGNGDGRSNLPFNALNNAAAASAAGSFIYVHSSVVPTPGNLAMDANQTLHGQGAIFTLNNLTIPSATQPTLSGTVTLSNNDVVRAMDFSPSGIPAMTASALTGPVTIDQVNVSGGTNGLSLTNVSGAVTVTNTTFTNSTGPEVLINQGTGAVTVGAIISNNAGRSVDIQNRTSGTVSFSQPITDTGSGIFLNANTGSTINFTGALTLNTGANPAFTATGGGTVSVAGSANAIVTTTGTAVNVTNTTIGAAGLTFRSISANGGTNGIVLNATGTGGLTVTGTGTTAGSGGTIQNTTTRGASFITASNISLSNMNFTNAATADFPAAPTGLSLGNNTADNAAIHLQGVNSVALDNLNINGSAEHGINGHNVNGFTLTNSVLANLGNGPDEDGLHFYNMVGTSAITNTSITSSGDDNINIQNNNNLAGDLPQTTTGTITITGGSANTGVLGSGYLFGIRGTMNTTVTINGVTSNNNFSGGIVIDTFDTATSVIEITNSASTNNNDAISLSGASGNTRFDIHDNVSFAGTDFGRINILKAAFSTGGTLQGFIRNNPIVVTDGQTADGIGVFHAGGGTLTVSITGNDIDYRGTQRAILIQGGQDGSGQLNATVTGNTIDLQIDGTGNPTTGLLAQVAVASPSGDNLNMCANIGGAGALQNVFAHSLGGNIAAGDIRIRQRFVTTVSLPGYAGANGDNAAVVAYLAGRNTLVNSPTATATNEVGVTPGAGGFVNIAACTLPVFP